MSDTDFLTASRTLNGRDVLVKIEQSFNIRFKDETVKSVVSFGDLCDAIYDEVKHSQAEGCTTQQAFYKFRNAVMAVSPCGKSDITPACRVKTIFPCENRIELIEQVEAELGYKINILQPKPWISALWAALFLASVAVCFMFGIIGVAGILIAAGGYKLSTRYCNELNVRTVGDLIAKMVRDNHLKTRRPDVTVSRRDIEQKVRELFAGEQELKQEIIFG